jgi:hypothetical protein
MRMRKRDLSDLSAREWVLIMIVIVFGGMAYIFDFGIHGRYLEAILSALCVIGFILILSLGFLKEILGSIRDLNAVLKGREKEDPKKPA